MKETKYMSKDYTNYLRGIFAILVVIHHLYQYTGLFSGTYIGTILQLFGFLSVAMFLFFSGYGLMLSANRKNYIKQFFCKRFLPLYFFYVFLIILYSLWTIILEKSLSPQQVVQSFFFGGTIVTNGWYLQVTFFVYLLYFFVFKIFKSSKMQILSFGIGIFAYCIFCLLLKLGINWYQTIPCVLFGMVYCYKKEFIDARLKKYAWIIFILCSMLFTACFILSAIGNIDVIFDMLYSLFFVCAMITLSYILCNTSLIENKFTKLCGKYSLEIYVTHGLFLRLIKLGYIKNVFLYIIVVIIGTIVMSAIIKKVYIKIVMFFKENNFSKSKVV